MSDENTFYRVSSFKDIDYQAILNDYRMYFHGKVASITTNYKVLEQFKVVFNQNDLPHLMGWEKVATGKANAKHLIKQIDNGKFTLENTRNHHNFDGIRNRLLNYNYLHDIFIRKNVQVCIMTSSLKPNPLRLDIVFLKELPEEEVILGLRELQSSRIFVPTTLHTESKQNRYRNRRRASMTSINFI